MIIRGKLVDKVRRASLKVIWWPGGTRSVVHVTRRPNPSIAYHKTTRVGTGHKLPAALIAKREIWW
jgi:hypothetical protein